MLSIALLRVHPVIIKTVCCFETDVSTGSTDNWPKLLLLPNVVQRIQVTAFVRFVTSQLMISRTLRSGIRCNFSDWMS